ncbi:MAG: helix-turn-helix domain-containing protein [Thermoguttaceae bacterium]
MNSLPILAVKTHQDFQFSQDWRFYMANLLTMADIQAILHLHEQGWRQRRIARELHVDRETVAKYIQASGCVPKPAKAPIGSDVAGDQATESLESSVPVGASIEEKGIDACQASPC